MKNNNKYLLYLGDCLDLMKDIPDKTIDLALLEYFIKTYTNEGDLVLDNCMGSGSTGIACLNTNRKFIGIEKEKKYFNIAKERLGNVEGAVFNEIYGK